MEMNELKNYIRDVPNFPKPGIIFKDMTPLLMIPEALSKVIDLFVHKFSDKKIGKIIGIESRGFIFGSALALKMGVGFVPVRKKGKLPWKTTAEEYSLEYGTDTVEIHADALSPNERVLIVDDLLATGGTAAATARLVAKQKAVVESFAFVVELDFLSGRKQLGSTHVESLIHY